MNQRKKLTLRTQDGLQMMNYGSLKDRQCKKKPKETKEKSIKPREDQVQIVQPCRILLVGEAASSLLVGA